MQYSKPQVRSQKEKEKENGSRSHVWQGGIVQLTDQKIRERVERMEIIQQDVRNGTYDDPNKPYHRLSRWVEYEDPVTNANVRSRSRSALRSRSL